jgi:hypothetical protein
MDELEWEPRALCGGQGFESLDHFEGSVQNAPAKNVEMLPNKW